jgi:rhamnose utilization protein RhaD (predicted bifunctional aldolase and dehydrogenase)
MPLEMLLHPLSRPRNRWGQGQENDGVHALIRRARLLAADPQLLNPGGGNFSTKDVVRDHLGRACEAVWVSGWGADGASLDVSDCSCLRLEDLALLRGRRGMSDTEMMDHLLLSAIRANQPHPAIETLTHAFLGARHVDHTHPEAVIALTAAPEGRRLALDAFGDEALWLDYQQFKADLANEIARRLENQPRARFVLMANHGLLAWGDTSRSCYEATLEATSRAIDVLEAKIDRRPRAFAQKPKLTDREAEDLLAQVLPVMRREAATGADGLIAHADLSPLAREFSCSDYYSALSSVGPACPDSLIKTKQRPLVITYDPSRDDTAAVTLAIRAGTAEFVSWYKTFCKRYGDGDDSAYVAPGPRVVIIAGVGVVTFAEDAALAKLTKEHFQQTMRVITATGALGGYTSLTDAQAFADEYWPLMRYKPQLQPPQGALCGRVALVNDSTTAIGEAIAAHLMALDAHVVLGSANGQDAELLASRLSAVYGEGRALGGALSDDDHAIRQLLRRATLTFGGLDSVIHSGGNEGGVKCGSLTSASLGLLKASGWGSIVVIETAPEPSTNKLACDARKHGVKVHTVRCAPDSSEDLARHVVFMASSCSRPCTTIYTEEAVA